MLGQNQRIFIFRDPPTAGGKGKYISRAGAVSSELEQPGDQASVYPIVL